MKNTILICLALFGLVPLLPAQETPRKGGPAFPSDIRVERSVRFLAEGRKQRADLYFPLTMPVGESLPAVVLIHGGGWINGRRDDRREINIGSTLARHGYVTMSIEYQLSDRKQAVWPTNLWDCKTAVRWLRKNAATMGVDPDRIGVIGGSAGGHLAAMVALTGPADGLEPAGPGGDVSDRVKCCVDLYGIADLSTYHDVTMLGQTFAEAPEAYRLASPLTYVRSTAPPFLILHGTADTTVNISQSERLDAALAKAGVKHQFKKVAGAAHTFDLQPSQADLRPLVLDFLDQNLKQP